MFNLSSSKEVLSSSRIIVKYDQKLPTGQLDFINAKKGQSVIKYGINFSDDYEEKLESNIAEIMKYCNSNNIDSIGIDLGNIKKDLFFLVNTFVDDISDYNGSYTVNIYAKRFNVISPKYLDKFEAQNSVDVVGYVEDRFERFQSHLKKELNLRDYLFKAMRERKLDNKDVYHKGSISKSTYSKILNGTKKHQPTRETMAQLVIGLKLSLEEAEEMYNSAGYHLGTNEFIDKAIRFFIFERIYDVDALNDILIYYGFPPLGEKENIKVSYQDTAIF